MNKDNYIRLLEKENQEYFEKVMKPVKDSCCHEILELNDDLNDLQADWAADHAEYRKTLETIKEQNTRECDLNVRLQGEIVGLQSGATKPKLDPDFVNEGFAITFNSELEYWSFMELCWGANLEWPIAGDPRKSRPKELFLMAHAVSCWNSHLEFATPVYYECELGYEIIQASEYLAGKK